MADLVKKDSLKAPSSQEQAADGQRTAPPQSIEIDDAGAIASYTNFCRVTGTPEELIVDFGLNPQPTNMQTHPIRITQRLVMNYFTAKRLLGALRMSLDRHEAAFGVVETNIQMRVQQPVR